MEWQYYFVNISASIYSLNFCTIFIGKISFSSLGIIDCAIQAIFYYFLSWDWSAAEGCLTFVSIGTRFCFVFETDKHLDRTLFHWSGREVLQAALHYLASLILSEILDELVQFDITNHEHSQLGFIRNPISFSNIFIDSCMESPYIQMINDNFFLMVGIHILEIKIYKSIQL